MRGGVNQFVQFPCRFRRPRPARVLKTGRRSRNSLVAAIALVPANSFNDLLVVFFCAPFCTARPILQNLTSQRSLETTLAVLAEKIVERHFKSSKVWSAELEIRFRALELVAIIQDLAHRICSAQQRRLLERSRATESKQARTEELQPCKRYC